MPEERRILAIFSSLDGRAITAFKTVAPDPAAVLRMNFGQFSAALNNAFTIPEARHQIQSQEGSHVEALLIHFNTIP
jgi:hypothetical protein